MNKLLPILLLVPLLTLAGCGRNGTPEPDTHDTATHVDHGDEEKHAHAEHAEYGHDSDGHGHDDHPEKDHDDHDTKGHDEAGHDHAGGEGHGEHEEEGVVHLTPEQMRTAGIVVTPLQPQPVAATITAPGEVKLNAYRTVNIAPRIAAQVVARHARLGDEVANGRPLVTLSSVAMAEAQGALLVAAREWQRVKRLGRKVVSERRYTEARVRYEQALAKVKAYGMTAKEIDALLAGKSNGPDGTFQLISPQAGRVLRDDFIVGQRVEPGQVLMVIADESVMWVEARIKPEIAGRITIGATAEIRVDGHWLPAKVSQIHHTLDETTRTLAVRLAVANEADRLHPGMFVTARIRTTEQQAALTLPEEAVLRSPDGDWQVFVQQAEPGEFRAVEVTVLRISDGRALIAGLTPGTPVVTAGAFFVQSEIAKGGFEIHNH